MRQPPNGVAGRCKLALAGASLTGPLSCLKIELLLLVVFGRFALVVGHVGLEMANRHTWPQRGRQRVFLPLPLHPPNRVRKNRTRGHTWRDRGVSHLAPLRGGGRTGVQGAVPPAKQADGVKPDALLASLGSDGPGEFRMAFGCG